MPDLVLSILSAISAPFIVFLLIVGPGVDASSSDPDGLANLALAGPKYPDESPTPGRPYSIMVTVLNTGQIEAENVTVRFYQERRNMGEEQLNRVPVGACLTASFDWVTPWGKHSLRWVVDPDNTIPESNEKDNSIRQALMVGEPEYLPPGFEMPALFLAIVVVLVALRRRRISGR